MALGKRVAFFGWSSDSDSKARAFRGWIGVYGGGQYVYAAVSSIIEIATAITASAQRASLVAADYAVSHETLSGVLRGSEVEGVVGIGAGLETSVKRHSVASGEFSVAHSLDNVLVKMAGVISTFSVVTQQTSSVARMASTINNWSQNIAVDSSRSIGGRVNSYIAIAVGIDSLIEHTIKMLGIESMLFGRPWLRKQIWGITEIDGSKNEEQQDSSVSTIDIVYTEDVDSITSSVVEETDMQSSIDEYNIVYEEDNDSIYGSIIEETDIISEEIKQQDIEYMSGPALVDAELDDSEIDSVVDDDKEIGGNM